MQIQVHSDHNIHGHEALETWVKSVIEQELASISERITRVEAHLTDDNGHKKSADGGMRCVLEARLVGHQPLAVSENAATIHVAVTAASGKLSRLIDHTLERIAGRGPATPHRP